MEPLTLLTGGLLVVVGFIGAAVLAATQPKPEIVVKPQVVLRDRSGKVHITAPPPEPHEHRWNHRPHLVDPATGTERYGCLVPGCTAVRREKLNG